ncbi:uncharacterized protein BXZ73DRAFT_42820 [Epithele typhae]|uniref:uncharacterized protein n=1 Tax=Epithele typhae TaxID=378194 RepID=UPI0020075C67|nr:uncharacterized protein BXZ73DRAFT_42820 [Epithele typhae]KAH9940382.1 hypothetical protein BXZ73DRAFT_42820 [Epithele typhae]
MLAEQSVHDRVNLARLVCRLEKSVAAEAWSCEALPPASPPAWIRTRGMLQKIRHARKLLQSVQANGDAIDSASVGRFAEISKSLDHLESVVTEADKRVSPSVTRPPSILSSLPKPSPPPVTPAILEETLPEPTTTLLPVEETSAIATHECLLSLAASPAVRGPINPSETLLPPSHIAPAAKTTTEAAPAFMQNSKQLQEELAAQLAQMATQLKRNAIHFAGALETDKAVVLDAQEKLERNHDVMSRERVRLRDHHSKSWGTTWITLLSLVVVAIGFFLTFLVIRVT